MPVTTSAKKALRTATRRHGENLLHRAAFKQAVKTTRKAIAAGEAKAGELLSQAQSALDRAARKNTIHPNKAARLKSRLAKQVAAQAGSPAAPAAKAKAKAAGAKKKTGASKAASKKKA